MSPSASSSSSSHQTLNLGSVKSTAEATANSSANGVGNAQAEAGENAIGPGVEEDSNADPPYSHLIYEALKSAPGMKLPLQGIYGWFENNTAKGRDQNSKGWQNSIRHNLSMNAV